MCPFRLYHCDPHWGQASLGVLIRSPTSSLLTFAYDPDYHKASQSITRRALPRAIHSPTVSTYPAPLCPPVLHRLSASFCQPYLALPPPWTSITARLRKPNLH